MEKQMKVKGMMCNHCKKTVEKAISAVPGVISCEVDLEKELASIVCDESVCDDALLAAVKAKDFSPSMP